MDWTEEDQIEHDQVCWPHAGHMPDDAGLHEYDDSPDDDAVAVAVECEWFALRKETTP